MEIVDIGLSEFDPPMNIRFSDDSPSSSNFGMGIEMLMNDKHRSGGSSSKIDMGLGELDRLESELNDLGGSGREGGGDTKVLSGFSNMFGFGSGASEPKSESIKLSFDDESDSRIGHATAESVGGNTRTWDGYHKVNEVPLSDSNGYVPVSDRERRRKKRAMLKKLDEWSEKGFLKNSTRFNIDSAYEDIEDEFEAAMADKRKSDAVKLQGWWFMSVVNSIEYANTAFNPFDLNLDGWAEKVSEDLDDYEEIFSQLHDKYNGVKLSPELSILLRLGFSAVVVNITNQSFSTATPGFGDVMKQNPGMMKQFSNAVVNSMSNQNPLFAMANNMLNKEPEANTTFGPPPAPINTQSPSNIQAHSSARPGMTYTQSPGNRPDLAAGRGGIMFREQGVDLTDQNGIQQQEQQRQQQQYYQQQQQDQQRVYQQQQQQQQQQMQQQQQQDQQRAYEQQRQDTSQRPEMKGPQHNIDINNILAGLKTRAPDPNLDSGSNVFSEDTDSMISINSIRDMNNTSMPKRANSRRKQKSDKNVISLDI